jgi:hypothetical protein
MWQRIQTVYLLIAAGALGLQFFLPILRSSQTALDGIYQDGAVYSTESQGSMIGLGITAISILIAIFLFGNRKWQRNFVMITILFLLTANLLGAYDFMIPTQQIQSLSHADIFPGLGAFMPLISLVAMFLAYKGIKKDDKIVQSMDRLR